MIAEDRRRVNLLAEFIYKLPTEDFGGLSTRDAEFLARALDDAAWIAHPATSDWAEAWDEGYARGSEDEHRWCRGGPKVVTDNPYR